MRTDTRVFIGFDSVTPGLTTEFRLDDDTQGVLDNTNFTLGPITAADIDVTADVRSLRVRRGRSTQLEQFQAGGADVVLDNRVRQYDPVNALVQATRINLVPNPRFADDLTGWGTGATDLTVAGASASYSGERGAYGATSARVTATATGEGFTAVLTGLEPLTTYRVSGYVWVESGAGVRLTARDTVNDVTSLANGPATAGAWTRLSTTVTTGAATPDLLVAFAWDGAGTAYVDAVIVETGTALGFYFDGDVTDGRIIDPSSAWLGTPNGSASELTYRVPGTGSPYWPSVLPRTPIRITSDGFPVFTGQIEDWGFDYSQSKDAVATTVCADAFALLAQAAIDPVNVPAELSGERLETVLDLPEVSWPASLRFIDTGTASLGAQDIGGSVDGRSTNLLEYLQRVEQAEQGALFVTNSGSLRFIERGSALAFSGVVFSDTGANIPFVDITIDYGTELLRNRVTINREGGALITAENPTSIARYGVAAFDIRDSLLATDQDAEDLAVDIVDRFGEPLLRVDRITVDLGALTDTQRDEILAVELGQIVTINFTPQGVGAPISQALQIDSIEHEVTVSDHRIAFDTSLAVVGFVLDDAIFGILDTGILG
jgi:hypothetical protein